MDAKREFLMQVLDELADRNPGGYQLVVLKLRAGFSQLLSESLGFEKTKQQDDEKLKRKYETQDRVIAELRKQIGCYKQEIADFKKMQDYLKVENYNKLV